MTTQAQVLGLGIFPQHGFTLEQSGDHLLLLLHEGEELATLSQTGATQESIQAECAEHLVKCHGWDGCLWQKDAK